MQFVCTEGDVTLEPVPGSEEGTRSGYLFKIRDRGTGIEFVIAMGHEHAAKLGAAMVKDTDEHAAAPAPISIVQAPAHLANEFRRGPRGGRSA